MITKMSERGQVVVPKLLRDLKGWTPGIDLKVVDAQDGVLLRPRRSDKKLTVAEAVARLQKIYTHRGPPVPIADMKTAAMDEVAERHLHSR